MEWLLLIGVSGRRGGAKALEAWTATLHGILKLALGEFAERSLGAAITQLRDVYRETVLRTVGDLPSHEDITWFAHRFAHIPVKVLRGLARTYGLEIAYSFLDEAGLIREIVNLEQPERVMGLEQPARVMGLEQPEERVMVGA